MHKTVWTKNNNCVFALDIDWYSHVLAVFSPLAKGDDWDEWAASIA